jgi:Dihydrodipicolinate reductase
MKIAIVGYGKMGRLIEQLAPEYGCEVGLKLDEFNNAGYAGITRENFQGIDVAIEFSTPEAAVENIERWRPSAFPRWWGPRDGRLSSIASGRRWRKVTRPGVES